MLDKDKLETIIEMDCGCILSHKHYFNSGFQYDTPQEHLKHKFSIDINKDNIRTIYEQKNKGYNKLLDGIEIKELCITHADKLIMNIISETVVHYLKK